MNCMRCGRQTEENQVFCSACLKDMDKYPVKPGTTVYIPTRTSDQAVRKNRPKPPTPEEQIAQLRHTLRILLLVLLAVLTAFAISAGLLIHTLNLPEETVPLGQNFGTAQSVDASEES